MLDEQTGVSCSCRALMPMAPPSKGLHDGFTSGHGMAVAPSAKEDTWTTGCCMITGIVEKPQRKEAPSNYAAIGGYVITPGVIDELREQTETPYRWYGERTTRPGDSA